MKKVVSLLLCLAFVFCSVAFSSQKSYNLEYGSLGEFVLEPGRYVIGDDIPEGYYDVRMKGLDETCTLRFSLALNLDDTMNMETVNSWELTFTSKVDYWQGCHPNVFLWGYSFLEIEGSACTFYPIDKYSY